MELKMRYNNARQETTMSGEKNLSDIIAFFGDTKLNANPNFKKYKEFCPFDPYGTNLKRSYRARLSDITSVLNEVKKAFKEAGKLFHDDIFVIVELSFLKESSGCLNICVSAFPYVAFCNSDDLQCIEYCGGKEAPAAVMTEDANEAEKYLNEMLSSENIVKTVINIIRS